MQQCDNSYHLAIGLSSDIESKSVKKRKIKIKERCYENVIKVIVITLILQNKYCVKLQDLLHYMDTAHKIKNCLPLSQLYDTIKLKFQAVSTI